MRRAQQIVTAALSHAAFDQGFLGRLALLRQARQGIVFARKAKDWFSRPPLGREGGIHPGDIPLHPETLLLQEIGLQF